MAEGYDRERQNNERLDELSAKVSALRGVTVDIYDSSRAHEVIDSTVSFASLHAAPPFLDHNHYGVSFHNWASADVISPFP